MSSGAIRVTKHRHNDTEKTVGVGLYLLFLISNSPGKTNTVTTQKNDTL